METVDECSKANLDGVMEESKKAPYQFEQKVTANNKRISVFIKTTISTTKYNQATNFWQRTIVL